jgi:integrase
MRGFVTQKKGRAGWYPVLSLPGNKKKWLRRCFTKREAERLLTQEVSRFQSSGWYPASGILFRDFAERWLRECVEGRLKPSTTHGYRSTLCAHLLPAFGFYRLDRITPEVIQAFVTERLKAGMNTSTLNRVIRELHTILERARRWRYLSENPATVVERPRVRKHPMDYLRPQEIGLLLEATPPERRLLFKVAVLTGLRMGELLAMKWEHLDWQSSRYHVTESLWRGRGGFQFVSPKTETSRRTVRLQPGLLEELRVHRGAQDRHRLALGDGYADYGLIFCQSNGRPLDPRNLLQRDFWGALRRAGLRRIRFHDLRHTFAALMIAQGAHAKAIQEAMGHSSITVTMNTYGHLMPRLLEEVADRVEASLQRLATNNARQEG